MSQYEDALKTFNRLADEEELTGDQEEAWRFAIRVLEEGPDEPDDLNATLATIGQQCLQAVLAGGITWTRFMADAEQQTGLTWPQIKALLDQRHANRATA